MPKKKGKQSNAHKQIKSKQKQEHDPDSPKFMISELDRSVYVVRHGERKDKVEYGWVNTAKLPNDPPLTRNGVMQASSTGQRIFAEIGEEEKDVHIFSSPFLRCIETANEIASYFDSPIQLDDGLMEGLSQRYFSSQPRLTKRNKLYETFPRIDTEYETLGDTARFPETFHTMGRRYGKALGNILKSYPNSHIVLVTHGFGVEHLLSSMGKDSVRFTPYCGISRVIQNQQGWNLDYVNHTTWGNR